MGQILADFLEFTEAGLYCKYGDFYLDARKPVHQVIVSHAHADHTIGGCTSVYGTSPTIDFMKHRYGKNAGKFFCIKAYRELFTIQSVQITLFPAGHILGSAVVLMQYNGVRYVYTGDFKLQGDTTCESVDLPDADVLITETTFANPNIRHPDPLSEIQKLKAIRHPVLLGAYSLGKAQRLTRLITAHCPEKKIFVHHAILPFHRIYESNGIKLGDYQPYNRKSFKDCENDAVYLVPPLTFNSYFKARNVLRIFASGWSRLQQHNDASLYISDHVDWQDLLQVVGQINPKEIWTLHGDGRLLAEFYAHRINVKHL